MHKKSGSWIKPIIIGVVLIGLIAGYYYYLSNKKQEGKEEAPAVATAVQEVLLYNFEKNYPPTPKEVVKLFSEFTKCLYNETYTEEEFLQLAAQIEKLYDTELVTNKTPEQYIEDLRWDINQLKEQEITISSYSTSASTDVDFFSRDGYKWAKLYCSFTLRKGTSMGASNEVFLLRKDEQGHWKIYGWMMADSGAGKQQKIN